MGKGLEGRSGHDVDAKDFSQALVVHVERVRGCEQASFVGVEGACVFDNIDVRWWPSCSYVGYDNLLQQWPVTGEANVEPCAFRDMRCGRLVPGGNGG